MYVILAILLGITGIVLAYKFEKPDAEELNRRKLFRKYLGSPLEVITGCSIISVLLLFSLYGSKYQLLDLRASYCLVIVSFILNFIFFVIMRNQIIPYKSMLLGKYYLPVRRLAIFSFSVFFTLLISQYFLLFNGKLDKSNVKVIGATVIRKSIDGTEHMRHLHLSGNGFEDMEVGIGNLAYDKKQVGTKVYIKIKSGFFHIPWIVGFLDNDLSL